MATKSFRVNWHVIYKASSNSKYRTTEPILVGSSSNYQTFIGIPSAVRDALKTSSTATSMRLRMYVSDASAEWDLGKHKLTSAPTSSTMPWYTYEKAFQGYGSGWIEFNLSGSVFEDEYKAGTYQGIVLYSGTSNYGEARNSSTYQMVIEVDGTWNEPPTAPTISYPKGGEIVDQSLKITWSGATDPNGDALKYKIAINDGTGWKYSGYTATGATSYTWNTSALAETSNAQIAVKSYDGELESAWRYSNKFTISHNVAPTAPTNLSPANGAILDRTGVIRFSWKHNDDGAQAGFQLAWKIKGSTDPYTYIPSSTTYVNSINQFYDMPANTLPFGDIEWTVKTKDQQGLTSPYSSIYPVFKASNPTNAPTILQPITSGDYYNSSDLVIEWSSLNQIEYEVLLYDTDGLLLWSQTGSGGTKLLYPNYQLENNKGYEVIIRSKDSTTLLWSDYTSKLLVTSFSPPLAPYFERIETAGAGVFNLFYKATDVNFLPDLLVYEGEINPLWTPQDTTIFGTDVIINSVNSFTASGASHGVVTVLDVSGLPADSTVTAEFTTDVQGGVVYLEALGAGGVSLGSVISPTEMVSTTAGLTSLPYTLPAGTLSLVVVLGTTWDNTNTVLFSGMNIHASIPTGTDFIEVFRREYTPTNMIPWTKIAEGLSITGSFLEYTPASGIIYEYKVRAISLDGTIADSVVLQASQTFNETFIQEANNLSNIVAIQYATTKSQTRKVDSNLIKFAGRVHPVREFGENEELQFNLNWEVDTYQEVLQFEELITRRDVLLFRDRNGRRYWVTTDELQVTDKELIGFQLSATFEMTDFIEDLTKKGEGEA